MKRLSYWRSLVLVVLTLALIWLLLNWQYGGWPALHLPL